MPNGHLSPHQHKGLFRRSPDQPFIGRDLVGQIEQDRLIGFHTDAPGFAPAPAFQVAPVSIETKTPPLQTATISRLYILLVDRNAHRPGRPTAVAYAPLTRRCPGHAGIR